MISINVSLEHLAWSNQKIFSFFAQQPDEVFGLSAAEGEWPIGRILTHLAGSGEWYRYCLDTTPWTDLKPITTSSIASDYLPIMEELDAVLINHSSEFDRELAIQEEDRIITATTSLILSQAVMHAAEHKGQIAAIMKTHGFHLDLDSLDVWSFFSERKKS